MTKTKTARLSLTMPGSNDSQSTAHVVDSRKTTKANGPTGLRRPESKRPEKNHTTESWEQEPVSSRSISPTAPFSAASEQSRSPTSPTSPAFTSLPPFPPSPDLTNKHSREQSKSFFQNLKASKSSAKIQPPPSTIRPVPQDNNISDEEMKLINRFRSTPDLREPTEAEPVPDLPKLDKEESGQRSVSSSQAAHTIPRRPVGNVVPSAKSNLAMNESALQSPAQDNSEAKKNGKLFPSFMKRNYSGRPEDFANHPKPTTPPNQGRGTETTMKPPSRDRSTSRNAEENEQSSHHLIHGKPHLKDQRSQSFRDGPGSNLFKGFKSHTARAAKDIGKAGKGFFRNRIASNNAPPPDPSTYVLKILNLPLVEQTRITRIAKRLEDSKDKTEFWMPALPWRCIDFLNYTGCETEGLYRVPGSEKEVRAFKAKFDRDHDVNLFEEEDLYDVNTIGSLFKSWLRELPDDIFPQDLQNAMSAKYGTEEKVPDEVKTILSNLPPWNYYLLFAITCHLSLLHAYQDKNKMTFNNLYICFAPALRINGDCFRWLVGDWRSCWIGCTSEKGYLEAEYRLIEGDDFDSDISSQETRINDDGEPTPRAQGFTQELCGASTLPLRPPPKGRFDNESAIDDTSSTASHSREGSRATISRDGDNNNSPKSQRLGPGSAGHSRSASQLPELNFGKPISPISTSFGQHKN